MKEYIGFDTHKHYSLAEREAVDRRQTRPYRMEHGRGVIRKDLADAEPGKRWP